MSTEQKTELTELLRDAADTINQQGDTIESLRRRVRLAEGRLRAERERSEQSHRGMRAAANMYLQAGLRAQRAERKLEEVVDYLERELHALTNCMGPSADEIAQHVLETITETPYER